MDTLKQLVDKLEKNRILSSEEFVCLLQSYEDKGLQEYLFEKARNIRHHYYGNDIYIRGLIEFTNYCKNDCYYCGIRKSNPNINRYRLSKEEILSCCASGYELGFRTFVLQGGEDGYYTDNRMVDIIHSIKKQHPDCAITLSIGEHSKESYKRFFDAGAERYLLRHETYNQDHYRFLHPESLSPKHRQDCLFYLKDIGYQVGTGFMVGSPGQTFSHLAEDLLFLKELNPQMVGIGPFIPHHDTKFRDEPAGSLELTLFLLGIIRLMLPKVLLPATTALGTIHPMGRERGIQAGANVVMPNLSPVGVRKDYSLYDNKICTGDEAAECRMCLQRRMESIGYQVVVSRGDSLNQEDSNQEYSNQEYSNQEYSNQEYSNH